jgi:hypothetical protein
MACVRVAFFTVGDGIDDDADDGADDGVSTDGVGPAAGGDQIGTSCDVSAPQPADTPTTSRAARIRGTRLTDAPLLFGMILGTLNRTAGPASRPDRPVDRWINWTILNG